MSVVARPIAVLAPTISEGFEYALALFKDQVAEFSNHTRTIILKNGDVYLVVNSPEQLAGLLIKDYRICPGFGQLKSADLMIRTAGERMRANGKESKEGN